MNRLDIVLVNLDPKRGSEADKIRPALVVSNNGANAAVTRNGRGVITVLPITSNVARIYTFQVKLDADAALACGLDHVSKIQAEQIRAVDVSRVGRTIGRLPADLAGSVDRALAEHLSLS